MTQKFGYYPGINSKAIARGCFLWLAVYLATGWALYIAVQRRVADTAIALIAAGVASLIVTVGLGHFVNAVTAFRDLRLMMRGADREPRDGERCAVTGRIEPAGSRALHSPITGTLAVAYKYEIAKSGPGGATAGKWEGVALVPCAVRQGTRSIRLLALPELAFPAEHPTGSAVAHRAEQYIRTTTFTTPVDRLSSSGRPDVFSVMRDFTAVYRDADGSIRQDTTLGGDPTNLSSARFTESVVRPGDIVRVIGRYSAAENGLAVDPRATMHSIRLEKGESLQWPLRKIGGALMNGVVFLTIVAAALTMLYALVPLEVTRPSWPEIAIENKLDQQVRPRIAALEIIPFAPIGHTLRGGEARGVLRTSHGDLFVTESRARRRDDVVDIHIDSEEGPAMVLSIDPANRLREVRSPHGGQTFRPATFDVRDDEPGMLAGRLTWKDGHVVFFCLAPPARGE